MAEDKPAKPKVTLEGIANSSAALNNIAGLAKDDYAGRVHSFYNYLQSLGGNPEEIKTLRSYQENPYNLSSDIANQVPVVRDKVLKETEAGLGLIVGKLDEDSLSGLAVKYGLRDKKYQALIEASELKDAESVVKLVKDSYLERNKNNKDLVELAKTWGPRTWLGYVKYERSRIEEDFLKKNLYTTKTVEKDGVNKPETKYDSAKAQGFLLKSLKGLEGNAKIEAMLEMASIAHALVEQEKAKKAKEAAEAAKKK